MDDPIVYMRRLTGYKRGAERVFHKVAKCGRNSPRPSKPRRLSIARSMGARPCSVCWAPLEAMRIEGVLPEASA